MAGEAGFILKLVEPIKSMVFGVVLDYLSSIGSCEDNLCLLRTNLCEVCDKKDDINKKVKQGKDNQQVITSEAVSWLKNVGILSKDEELKDLMYKDLETAKLVVKMMEKKDLKKCISKEREMQEVVVKVMKMLKDEMEKSVDDARMMAKDDYKQVAEVVVEVMKDATEEFKRLIKEDKTLAIIAARSLMDSDLDKLRKGDIEMEEIVRQAGNVSDDELWLNCEDEDQQETNALLVKAPAADADSNLVKEAAKKLFTPLRYLLTPLGKMMDDPNFKSVVPEANSVKFGLEVVDGLLTNKGKNDSMEQQRGCCSCTLSLSHYHGRYHISKAAELMANRIKDTIISKCPQDPVTLPISTVDLKLIPTRFLKGLDSRVRLLHDILKMLRDDQVDVVGVFGMGGTGKTTLAKEVNKRAKDIFSINVMVEISDAPDIMRIQAAIAKSIDLSLHDVENIALRATKLYNRLNSEKEKKILVILDNIWKKLDLDEIGIPSTCKLLLTTREKEVCRVMGVLDVNIVEVNMMNANEARELFNSQIGNQAKGEYIKIADRLLSKCGGLPLAIVATANSLKGKDVSNWKKFADNLERPTSSQITGDFRHTYSILDTSYKFIEGDGKRVLFLLVCLSPLGSSVSIHSLLRYGIGLNLFQHVNKLDEAVEEANRWATELKLSSMLLEGDVKGDVKIHDIVRAFGISFAAKEEGHNFLVESFPRWLDDESFNTYTAISLMSGNDYSRLSGVEAVKLQILILRDDLSHKFSDSFFEKMVNLVVLSLSNMHLNPSLPESMRKLKRLKTLCLEGCKLGDIKLIGELVNLLVLSLRESFMEELPNEIGELRRLRLLDVSGCTSNKVPLIPAGMLGRLTKLEGLYGFSDNQAVAETKCNVLGAGGAGNNSLPYLSALEIEVSQIEELPIDYESIQNLDEFRVHVGDWLRDSQKGQFRRVLKLKDMYDMDGVLDKSRCLKPLLKKADLLAIEDCKNFEHVVPQLDQEGFRNLKDLALSFCDDVKCIVQGSDINDSTAFPHLESLRLIRLNNLEMVCDEKAPPRSFSNLQNISLNYLKKMLCVLPLAILPPNLNEINVSSCKSMKFLFTGDEETQVTKLAFLKSLTLFDMEDLLSLVGPTNFSNTSDAMQDHRIFFTVKIELPSLERLKLYKCRGIVKLWGSEAHASGFQNLKDIRIEGCKRLLSIGPLSVLKHLETLRISACESIEEIVTFEGESKIAEQNMKFLELRYLELIGLKKLKRFYGGSFKLEFPKLNKLTLTCHGTMNTNAESENSSVSFHEKIDYPCLEELKIQDAFVEVVGLWNWQSLNAERGTTASPAAILKKLILLSAATLEGIPSIIFENLSTLGLCNFEVDHALFSSREGFAWTYNQLPRLQELSVAYSTSLKELFEKEDCNGDDDALTLFCGRLKELELSKLPELNYIPLHLFKSLALLSLFDINWEYLISADAIGESLQQLESLSIEYGSMKALVVNAAFVIELPRLKKLVLTRLDSFSISTVLRLRSLESLEIQSCDHMKYFWPGSIVAPNLQHVKLEYCDNMEHLLDGNPEQNGDLHLPSLVSVEINWCLRMRSFSLTRPVAPKLTHVLYNDKEYSMLQFEDLNDFLRTQTTASEEEASDSDNKNITTESEEEASDSDNKNITTESEEAASDSDNKNITTESEEAASDSDNKNITTK